MNIKKLIAREGLIILGIVAMGCFVLLISSTYPPLPNTKSLYEGLSSAEKKSIEDLIKFRQLFPEYDDLDNLTLVQKLASKLPEYQDMFNGIKEINKRLAPNANIS